jgi:ABC-type Mn2+/Zn2+ transport system ATPase subunit
MTPASNQENVRIFVEDVTVDYSGNIALRDAHLKVYAGSICGLIGVNGSGKSTLFKTIMGLLTPSSGRVQIDGMAVRKAQRLGRIAYVPQAEEIDWNFPVSVWDVALMGRYGYMNILRTPRAIDREKASLALEEVQLSAYKNRQIGELSGGQKKRAFLARALAQEADIMLLDEPFTGVDAKTQSTIIDLLTALRARGCTILISTHDLSSVEAFCDSVALVNRTVLTYGPTQEVFTPENIDKAFGGVLRHLRFNLATNNGGAVGALNINQAEGLRPRMASAAQ